MSLWGKNDNKLSDGTVSVNHANRTVTGSGTTFGSVGCGATGDIIRFGEPLSGPEGYFGEAVIIGIAGTQSIVIDSTAGLSAQEITDKNYQITQTPKSTVTNSAFNKFSRSISQAGDVKMTTTVVGDVAVGGTSITIAGNATGSNVTAGNIVIITHGDLIPRLQFSEVHSVVSGGSTILLKNGLKSTHNAFKTDGEAYTTAVSVVNVQEAPLRALLDGGSAGAKLTDIKKGDTFTIGTNSIGIGTVTPVFLNGVDTRILTLDGNLTQPIAETPGGATVILKRGAIDGSKLVVRAIEDVSGDETQTLGVSTAGVAAANKTAFETGAGWVGVQTYTDMHGNARVKKEVFVAMSGIQTGNAPIYDGNPYA
tara:strand:- start:4681 stop:5781 length:1101 start_codon:yes stop_codon:yes gene_type:complete